MSLACIRPLFISPGPCLWVPYNDLQYWQALVDVSHEMHECSELTIQFKHLLGFFSCHPDRHSQASRSTSTASAWPITCLMPFGGPTFMVLNLASHSLPLSSQLSSLSSLLALLSVSFLSST